MVHYSFAVGFSMFLLGLIIFGIFFVENLHTQQDSVVQCELTGGVCISDEDHRSVCENASGGSNYIITDRGCPKLTVCCVPQKTIQTI